MPESSSNSSTALVAIDFHGDQIVTCQHNGEPHVAMRRLVDNLGLNWAGQHAKLVAQQAKFACMDIHTHDTLGRAAIMLGMPVSKLPLWLATINPNKIPDPEKRAKVELYQEESAIVLHDYWTKGIAVRGDTDGMITGVDPTVMRALGGMMKGIVAKALGELLPSMVEREVHQTQAAVARGLTAGEVVEEAGVTNRKGLRGLPRRVSDHLRRFASEKGVVVPIGRLGSSTAYVFDAALAREWLAKGGKAFIERIAEEKRGQGALKLIR